LCVEGVLADDQRGEAVADPEASVASRPAPKSSLRRNLLALVVGVIVLDVLAFLVIPPFPAG